MTASRMLSLLSVLLIGTTSLAEPFAGTVNPLPLQDIARHWQQNLLSPRIETFALSADELAKQGDKLCERISQTKLDGAREAWRATFLAWRALEPMPLGPVTSRRTAWKLDVWPTRIPVVEEAVKLSKPDQAISDEVGAQAQGLPALEYLLWGDDRANAQLGRLHFRQRCQYVRALALDTGAEAMALAEDWRRYQATPLSEETARQTVEQGFNMLVAALDTLRDKKLARAGKTTAKPAGWHDFDAWRSRQTHAAMGATLTTLEQALFEPAKDGRSFADHLHAAGKPMLVSQLKQEFDGIKQILAALPADIALPWSKQPELARPLQERLSRLQQLLEIQVADALGISIGFKDADGD